jgi:hypothetical protein
MFSQENITDIGSIVHIGSAIGTCSLVFCSAFFTSFLLVAFIHKKDITLLGKRDIDFRLSGDSIIYHHPGIDFEDTWQYDDDEYVGRESYEKDKIKEMAVFENTPSGDVYMEYNKEHAVFHYWSDRIINYSSLSTLARKYIIVFDVVEEESEKDEDEGDDGDDGDDDCSCDSDDFLFVKPKENNVPAGAGAGEEIKSLYRFIRKGSIEDYIFKQTVCDDDHDAPITMSYSDFIKNHGC